MNPFLLTDFYKVCHHEMYPEGLTKLVSYWTPRMTRIDKIDKVVMFGLQGFIQQYLIGYFNKNFFNLDKYTLMLEYKRTLKYTMGIEDADTSHLEALHDLGYLPLEISAVPEGTRIPIKTPMIQITNTHDDFAWLVNFIETLMSCHIWQPMTSATIAYRYREIMTEYYDKTVCDFDTVVENGAGDFSMRGMSCLQSAESSGAGHLLSFNKTATIPAIRYLENNYMTDIGRETVGLGAPSTEHSIMSSYGRDELFAYQDLIRKYPTGTLSIVSDTYDYWNVLSNIIPELKTQILARDGKLLIRGDSGCPIKIICGDDEAPVGSPEWYGTVGMLWNTFGGYVNSKGYKVLDAHVGAIYGDGITLERAEAIMKGLEKKGFAVSNVVLGIGSFTYQYNTRDTFGFALKATHAIINGKETFIYKEPKTDTDNFKKSQKGMCVVFENGSGITFVDNRYTYEMDESKEFNLLQPVFRDGKMLKMQSLRSIRERLWGNGR